MVVYSIMGTIYSYFTAEWRRVFTRSGPNSVIQGSRSERLFMPHTRPCRRYIAAARWVVGRHSDLQEDLGRIFSGGELELALLSPADLYVAIDRVDALQWGAPMLPG
jgi:hypothetical protein